MHCSLWPQWPPDHLGVCLCSPVVCRVLPRLPLSLFPSFTCGITRPALISCTWVCRHFVLFYDSRPSHLLLVQTVSDCFRLWFCLSLILSLSHELLINHLNLLHLLSCAFGSKSVCVQLSQLWSYNCKNTQKCHLGKMAFHVVPALHNGHTAQRKFRSNNLLFSFSFNKQQLEGYYGEL